MTFRTKVLMALTVLAWIMAACSDAPSPDNPGYVQRPTVIVEELTWPR